MRRPKAPRPKAPRPKVPRPEVPRRARADPEKARADPEKARADITQYAALRDAVARLTRAGCPEPRADAEVLLAHVLGEERARLFVRRDETLAPRTAAAFARCLARRARREPVAIITGEREFWSLPMRVSRAVLIPRPDTETLVEEALDLLDRIGKRAARVIDVGTGSGCVAIALAHERPDLRVWAIDRSARALRVAGANVASHGVARRVRLLRGDLLTGAVALGRAPIPKADLIVSNPPYVTESEWERLPPEIRDHEPRGALVGGRDGLTCIRRLARQAPDRLLPGGWIALEVGAGQAEAVADLLRATGLLGEIRVRKDLAGIPRVVAATLRSRAKRGPKKVHVRSRAKRGPKKVHVRSRARRSRAKRGPTLKMRGPKKVHVRSRARRSGAKRGPTLKMRGPKRSD